MTQSVLHRRGYLLGRHPTVSLAQRPPCRFYRNLQGSLSQTLRASGERNQEWIRFYRNLEGYLSQNLRASGERDQEWIIY